LHFAAALKVIRVFLGVHRFAPLAAINGDMGWTQSQVRRHICMFRFWNRIVQMDQNRLPKIVFEWDKSLNTDTWSSDIQYLMASCGQSDNYNNNEPVNLNVIWSCLHENFCQTWMNDVNSKPKLRTYRLFKKYYEVEPYVMSFVNRSQRSCLAQLRSGTLPLLIETGRWSNIVVEQRICKMCNTGCVETELHFLFDCVAYQDTRQNFFENVTKQIPDFITFEDSVKLEHCMKKPIVNLFIKFVYNIFNVRQRHLYM